MRRSKFVTNLLVLAGLASGLWGCAAFVLPVQPGSPLIEKPGDGLVFGRIAVIRDGEDQLSALPPFPKEIGWVLTQVRSGKRYVVSPLTQDGLFALDLPAGTYHVSKLMYEERAGLWEGSLPAGFTVQPGTLTYLGTWQIEFLNLGAGAKVSGKVLDQMDEAREDLQQRYASNQRQISVSLLDSAREGHLSLVRPRAEQ